MNETNEVCEVVWPFAQKKAEFRRLADHIRQLFCEDSEVRNTFGGPPYTDDLMAEMFNEQLRQIGTLDRSRARIRLGYAQFNQFGDVDAYAGFSLVSGAQPTAYEREYVWSHRGPQTINGIFLRRLIVRKAMRRRGLAHCLLGRLRDFATAQGKHFYADVPYGNEAMQRLVRKEGARENMFWHTPKDRLMIRYILI